LYLNLNQFRVFYTAAREGSFARAAEQLFITPQAVTYAIRGLETQHKIGLFQRVGRGVKLTQEGEILYEQARSVFEAADRLEQALEDLGSVGRRELRVGTTKMSARFLMSTITAFKEAHPEVTVMLRDGTSQEAVAGVESLAYHVAVVGRQSYSPHVRTRQLWHVEFIMASGPGHPFAGRQDVTWKELEGQPFVFREPGSGSGAALRRRLAEYGVNPRVVLETGSLELMKQYTAERGALAFFFEPDAQSELAAGRLINVPLREGPLTMEVDTVYMPDVYRSPAVRAFLAVLEEAANDDWTTLPKAATRTFDNRRPR
jgi:LysR family transcriptional regulator, low CO2-responsive transcriptional regulator